SEAPLLLGSRPAVSPCTLGGGVDRAAAGGTPAALNVYVDSSVLLRVITGEPGRLRIWSRITVPISSELVRLECLRTIDRARIQLRLGDEEVATRRAAVLDAIETFTLVAIGDRVLE